MGIRPSSFRAGCKRLIRRIQWKSYAFFHRSRKKPFALYEEQKPPRRPRGLQPRISAFLAVLCLLTVLALIYPLRPTYSEQERRDLTAMPSLTLAAVADGSFFSDLSTWFADTFPLRDLFLSLQDRVEGLYGVQTQTITGNVTQGDDIPVVSDSDPADTPSAEPDPGTDTDAGQAPEQPDAAEEDTPEEPSQPESDGAGAEGGASAEAQPEESADDSAEAADSETETGQASEDGDLTIPELDDDAVVEQLSAVLTIDNAGYEYYNFVQSYADNYTSAINRAAKQLSGISKVYSIIVPNSMGICVPTDVQEAANTSDQKAAIEYMNSCLSDEVTAVPVYNTLLKYSLEGEYLYFRTDHHWTAQGAYRAYEQFAAAAGFTPTPLERYTEHQYDGFLGTFYSSTKSEAMAKTPDTVYAYEAPSTNEIHITTTELSDWLYIVIGDVTNSSAGNKYGTFIGGDNPYSYIENPNKDDGSAIMLIKESYGNAFAPFLIENYQYVYIVDYRYVSEVDSRNLTQMCKDLGIDDVLFLNTISTTRADSLIQKLDGFVGSD